MHLGAWAQFDSVWWNQSPALRAAPGARPGSGQGVATGVDTGGIGQLEDGVFFRRIRPYAEGTFWDTGEYRLILALENDQFSTSGLDEILGRRNEPSGGRDRPDRTREDPHGPGRRHDRIEPLHDLHGALLLLRSDRTEPEFRDRRVAEQQLLGSTHDMGVCRLLPGSKSIQRRLFR